MNKNSSSTLFVEKEVKKSIMATDIYLGVAVSIKNSQEKETIRRNILKDIDHCFKNFKEFEQKYSRFKSENELHEFNNSVGKVKVSEELFEILSLAYDYYKITGGIFDISLYPNLVKEGYVVSSLQGYTKPGATLPINKCSVNDFKFNGQDLIIEKPEYCKVEIGGLGKGFIVDKVTAYLKKKYQNFVVDAGGDLFYSGEDLNHGYDYWAVEIENPGFDNLEYSKPKLPILILKDMAVATSGTFKRKWQKSGQEKNHLINPQTGSSLESELIFCTVIADTAVKADIYAKSILLMGLNKGFNFANELGIATLIMDKFSEIYTNEEFKKYVWKN